MKISAINNAMQSVNAVKFGTRHEESNGYQTRPHNAGIVKAVPLAVLIAMSPMTTANAETRPERIQPQEIEYVEIPSDQQPVRKEVARVTYPKASQQYGDATIIFYDNDGNTKDAEEVVIKFHVPRNPNNRHTYDYELVLDHLGYTEYTRSKEIYYGIYGKGTCIDTDTFTGRKLTKEKNTLNVNKEFADYLYTMFGDAITITKRVVDE